MNTQEKKESLLSFMEYMTDEQVELLHDLMQLQSMPNKTDLLKFAGYDTDKTYDTAFPIDYYRRIEETYPNIQKGNFIYDYSEKSFGELVNINDLIVNRILKSLRR